MIIPSIASANPMNLQAELDRISSIPNLHVDIEDGNFVPNITFGAKTTKALAAAFHGELDVHLMTTDPEQHLGWLAETGIKTVCAHLEALHYPKQFLQCARALGMRAGLAINLRIAVEELCSYLDALDYVLVMTSEPDGVDQAFFPGAFARVAAVRALIPPAAHLWCDGGITPDLLAQLAAAGMDTAVMGRAVFNAPDPVQALRKYERLIQKDIH